jgi:hypothetical protein
MPDIICTHCRGQYTSGCEYCNPVHTDAVRKYGPPGLEFAGYTPTEPPLTFDEIRKLRELLDDRRLEALLRQSRL